MNWEEAILEVRANPAYRDLVKEAYLGGDLTSNIERFSQSAEFEASCKELEKALGRSLADSKMLDIGAGNGISSVSFARQGVSVTALEPDPSDTIGAGAIRKGADIAGVSNRLEVVEAWGEALPFEDEAFDIVYGRQVMHHAHELDQFVSEAARVLKKGGVFMTTRDHVIKDDKDKEAFLERHPLHKFYGGENAFTLQQYTHAIEASGLHIVRSLDAASTAINYDPWGKAKVRAKFGILGGLPLVSDFLLSVALYRLNRIPGRLHTFVAVKK